MPAVQRVAVDGLRYAADMTGLSADRLYADLLSVSTATAELPPHAFTACFADAWSVVDNLWRLNLLVRRMPGLKRTPNVEAHLRALKTVEGLRHGHQHLDGRIAVCVKEQLPLWGTLSWAFFPEGPINPGKVIMMIPGSLRSGTSPVVNPAGQPIASAVDLVTLSAFGHDLQLSSLLRRVTTLIQALDQGLRRATQGQPGAGADALIFVTFEPGSPER